MSEQTTVEFDCVDCHEHIITFGRVAVPDRRCLMCCTLAEISDPEAREEVRLNVQKPPEQRTVRERPSWEPIWLVCKVCDHQWDDWQPSNVPAETWAAHVRTYRCPNCGKGGRRVLLRTRPLDVGFGSL